jgi:putative aldouronate transport system permease protein
MNAVKAQSVSINRSALRAKLWRQRYLYLLMLPGLAYFLLFKYGPMYGVTIAFKQYDIFKGVMDSPWVGLRYFKRMATTPYFRQVLRNTLRISLLKIATGFPTPILLALLLNELAFPRFKKIVQTISYLPHFLSWVIISGLIFQIVSPSYGMYGLLCKFFGWKPTVPLGSRSGFLAILLVSNIWKEIGYGSIIYLAAIAGINMEMYEAARIDGANRWKQCLHVTLPCIFPTISMMFILGLGGILDAGFDQVFNLYNSLTMPSADIIDTYVYRIGLVELQYSFSTAVNVSKSLFAIALVLSSNWFIGKANDYTVF